MLGAASKTVVGFTLASGGTHLTKARSSQESQGWQWTNPFPHGTPRVATETPGAACAEPALCPVLGTQGTYSCEETRGREADAKGWFVLCHGRPRGLENQYERLSWDI